MKPFALAFALAALATSAAAAPDAAPTAAEVLARAHAAQGGDAWGQVHALRTTGKASTGGLEGRFESLEDVTTGAWADRFDLGAFRGAQGYDGRTAWSQDSSGMARADGGEEATKAAASEAYRRARAYWFPGRHAAEVTVAGERAEEGHRFHVLAIAPKDGRPFEFWIDAATDLPARIVQREGPDTATTYLSDYREVPGAPGLRLPFASRTTTGNAKYDMVSVADAIEVNPSLEATAFALPPPPPADSGFAGGVRSATIRFDVVNGHVLLPVRLNGQGPFHLIFDTGGVNVVSPRVAATLGLEARGALEGTGTGEASEDISPVKVGRVDIGPAFLRDQTFFMLDLARLERVEGAAIDGIIGYEVFRRFIVRFDYGRGEVVLAAPAGWAYAGPAKAVPFVFHEHVPQVQGAIDGIPGRFDIDTGSRSSLDLFAPFVEKHQLAARYPQGPERITGWGVGGPGRGTVIRARQLRLGPVTVEAPVVELARATRGSFAADFVAGNVGYGILRRFDVTFDYGNQQIWFEPNRHAGEPDAYDRAGLWVNLAEGTGGPEFEVVEVVPGGPAAEAGLRAADRVLAIDGVPAGRLGLPAFRALLKDGSPGTRIELRVGGPSGERTVVVVLRDLV